MADIVIDGLNISVDNKIIFTDFSFTANNNSITGIFSPSGSGKTTLLNWISGLLEENFIHTPYKDFGKISYVFQEPRLIPNLTVFENIILPLKNIYKKNECFLIANEFLKKMEILEKKDSYPHELSGGEKQRVSIARAMAFPCDLLLLDEPFQSLDKELTFRILDIVKTYLKEKPRTVIFVSHIEDELSYLCENVVTLK